MQVSKRTNVSLADLFRIFLMAGLTFGGGLAIVTVLERELVRNRQATSRDDFLTYYALARVVPTGTQTALPLRYAYRRLKTNRRAQSFFKGLTTTALGLIF